MDIDMSPATSPITTISKYGHEHRAPDYIDLCDLLQTMSLSQSRLSKDPGNALIPYAPSAYQRVNEHAASTHTVYDQAYHSDASESSNSSFCDPLPTSSIISPVVSPPACLFLQSILASLAPASPVLSPYPHPYPLPMPYETTGGAYLDTLFTHRALFGAFPPAHAGCAVALSEIARALEVRAWRADRDADAEAIVAFRCEALSVASRITV
ncbi:hypothetical protein SERLA73DRAFT_191898 [Serpula lacrymans var. lacrymans S7.3]|uniref:Uncharacterized protein n=2 Tax=Serpula lacrymans var. lacrymans TaxID=341189 RepID=F8QIJ7_SERL3|nr:uncharacterized protein SERLADRAFT_463180 [Serpula lacrymans var. lacrymans S7.9]EGN91879.1 hypothetical protein SERLA73DRAFT_191898 [Serpula lacrymans var. lacrymans S7.3]EGO26287.1 hypothetical protein SERLADRAFT_463180 [Serpula lacrymans var. lacrymans S7.9]